MPFLGPYPYGTPGGADLNPDQSGTTVAQGIGRGCNFAMVTDGPAIVIPIPAATVLQRIYGTLPVTGLITTTSGTNVTIIVNSKGVAIDSAVSTLNLNGLISGNQDNSFLYSDSPAGTINLGLAYLAAGAINGTTYVPARADHLHNAQLPLFGANSRDEVASGQVTVSSTSDQVILTAGFTMPNDGQSYALVALGWGDVYNGTNNIWVGTQINGGGVVRWQGNIQSGPETRISFNWVTVTGAGQAVTGSVDSKIDGGSGRFGTGAIFLMGFSAPFNH